MPRYLILDRKHRALIQKVEDMEQLAMAYQDMAEQIMAQQGFSIGNVNLGLSYASMAMKFAVLHLEKDVIDDAVDAVDEMTKNMLKFLKKAKFAPQLKNIGKMTIKLSDTMDKIEKTYERAKQQGLRE